jgi:hypothetical protein
MLRRLPALASLLLAFSLTACGVGIAPGGDDDEASDGSGDGSGDGFEAPDAFPPEPILCATEYTVTGTDLAHTIPPGESCEGSGTWTITVGNAVADEDYTACADAPGEASFNLSVTATGEDTYAATDLDDGGNTWTVTIRDKGGSCAATFEMDLGGGAAWDLIPSEDGPDGPLHGTARFEKRSE